MQSNILIYLHFYHFGCVIDNWYMSQFVWSVIRSSSNTLDYLGYWFWLRLIEGQNRKHLQSHLQKKANTPSRTIFYWTYTSHHVPQIYQVSWQKSLENIYQGKSNIYLIFFVHMGWIRVWLLSLCQSVEQTMWRLIEKVTKTNMSPHLLTIIHILQ